MADRGLLADPSSFSDSDRGSTDEKDDQFPRHTIPRFHWRFRLFSRQSFAVGTALILVALLSIYYWRINRHSMPKYPSFLPQVVYEDRMFYPSTLYPGPQNDAEWLSEPPNGDLFVILEGDELEGLPPGTPHEDGFNRYGISWTHQYHCLWMLHTEFWAFVQNRSNLVGIDLDAATKDKSYVTHLSHCFDYLRQNILCNMDMTLEYPTDGENIDGYMIAHQCKKREPYDEFMKMHGPKDKDSQEPLLKQPPHDHSHHDHAHHS